MLAYIKGRLEIKNTNYVVIDVGGLGYKVYMSENAISNIGEIGEIVKVHTYYRVMEDDISIFGFNTPEELRTFELLISVSGIGAKLALTIIGSIEPSQFAISVISNDITTLKQIPGIGAKSAQRIVLELKDKIKKEQQISELSIANDNSSKIKKVVEEDNKISEAITALQVLGYTRGDIDKTIRQIDLNDITIEDIIKKSLKILSTK